MVMSELEGLQEHLELKCKATEEKVCIFRQISKSPKTLNIYFLIILLLFP